jgi:hypothetical protein
LPHSFLQMIPRALQNIKTFTLITYINTELQKLAVWFKANKLAVTVNKTNYIIF